MNKIALQALRDASAALGFADCRVAVARRSPGADNLAAWLAAGHQAGMDWMAGNVERRQDPRLVLPGCRSIILFAYPYGSARLREPSRGTICLYAAGEDYHRILEEKLDDLDALLTEFGGSQRRYVDSGPVTETAFAVAAGLGWGGKSGALLRPDGSRFFLGTILTTLELPADTPVRNRCGFCTRCRESCPTGALDSGRSMDARKCLSYWTIEHKGTIPLEIRPLIGHRLYGCDECFKVCPWNRKSRQDTDARFLMPRELYEASLETMAGWSEDDFKRIFAKSPIKRIKYPGWLRNVCVVMGNISGPEAIPALTPLTRRDDFVAEHARDAIARILSRADSTLKKPLNGPDL